MKNKSNIVLIGLPGCGKTTVGMLAAEQLQWDFADMDTLAEQLSGQSVPALFAQGEDCFRAVETEACRVLACRRRTVIAAGGGVVTREENIDLLRPCSLIVFLDRPAKEIVNDVDTSGRPLLQQGAERVFTLERERRPLYLAAADRVIAGLSTPEEAAEQICDLARFLKEEELR